MAVATAIFVWQIWGRAKLWRRGKPIGWRPDYLGGVVRYVLGQRKVRTSRYKSGAPMHLLIFYGFLCGVLLMTNALDGPIYLGLFIITLGIFNFPCLVGRQETQPEQKNYFKS